MGLANKRKLHEFRMSVGLHVLTQYRFHTEHVHTHARTHARTQRNIHANMHIPHTHTHIDVQMQVHTCRQTDRHARTRDCTNFVLTIVCLLFRLKRIFTLRAKSARPRKNLKLKRLHHFEPFQILHCIYSCQILIFRLTTANCAKSRTHGLQNVGCSPVSRVKVRTDQ